MKYNLIKLSSPDFELITEHIHIVHDVLDMYVCRLCRVIGEDEYNDWPDNYEELSVTEKVHVLLGTSCGAEYMLEENHVEGVTTTHETLF